MCCRIEPSQLPHPAVMSCYGHDYGLLRAAPSAGAAFTVPRWWSYRDMSGTSSDITPRSQDALRTEELLDRIVSELGIDADALRPHPAAARQTATAKEGETARLVLAFSRLSDPHTRSTIVRMVETFASRQEAEG
jgi:hypothetical protein